MKKKIIFITPGPTYRPHSDLYQSQFKELSRKFSGYIFTTSSKSETFSIDDFLFVSIKADTSRVKIIRLFFFCIWSALKFSLKGEKIDLVVTYDPLGTGLIGLTVSFICRAKFAPEVNGVYTSSAQWIDTPDNIQTRFKKMVFPLIMQFVLKRADGIKLLFGEQLDSLKAKLHGKMIQSFPCFVPVDGFKNIREEKIVLFVGFPFKLKGVDILIGAFKRLAPKHPEWKLKILGWYPDLEELNKAIDGHPQIYHHKPVPYQEMPEHIGACSIFVLPSRSEAMGRVLVEAMAAGKPRVGSNVDGIPTVINHNVDGILFESENIDDLAENLDRLMSDPDLRHKLGKAGEVRARQEFTEEEYVKKLFNFYDKVLNGENAGK